MKYHNLGTIEELRHARATLEKRIQAINIGDWYTFCCEEDLKQVKTQEEASELRQSFEDGESFIVGVWGSKENALKELVV